MTSEDIKQEIDREPFVPLRLHLSSGQKLDVLDRHTAWVRQHTLLLVYRLRQGTQEIGGYDVIAFRLIERVELLDGSGGKRLPKPRRKAS
jgi:hypothetical protein